MGGEGDWHVNLMIMATPISNISFTLNGQGVQLSNVSPHCSLNEWLRLQHGLSGTKIMCSEGGCGCCLVSATKTDHVTNKQTTVAINSVRSVLTHICTHATIHSVFAHYILSMDGQSLPLKELAGV